MKIINFNNALFIRFRFINVVFKLVTAKNLKSIHLHRNQQKRNFRILYNRKFFLKQNVYLIF